MTMCAEVAIAALKNDVQASVRCEGAAHGHNEQQAPGIGKQIFFS